MNDSYHDLEFLFDNDSDVLYRKKLLSNGQCAMFFASHYVDEYNFHGYYIAFAIANKFKTIRNWFRCKGNAGDLDVTFTGRCGLEGLIWARQCVSDLMMYIDIDHRDDAQIVIGATTNKRFRVYQKYLMSYGFRAHRYPPNGDVFLVRRKEIV